jgi:hypothetical protein
MSSVSGRPDIQNFYLQSVNYHTNTHLVNSIVGKHPRLLWLMLCAASPGMGNQKHQWVPQLKTRQTELKSAITPAESKVYFKKLYPSAAEKDVSEISKEFALQHKRKVYLAKIYPNLKIADIEVLNSLISDAELAQYERDLGN